MNGDPYFGFLAYIGEADIGAMLSGLDRGLAHAGFAVSAVTGADQFDRTYTSPAGVTLRCCGSLRGHDPRDGWTGTWGAWAFFPIAYSDLGAFGEGQLVEAIRDACVATRAVLGRSFHTGGIGHIDRGELDGRVDYVDWIQYYGPEVSAVLGAERIQHAGFHSVQRLPGGAHLALTRPGYLDRWPIEERRPLLARLGIAPRVVVHKQGDGREVEVTWC
jgi:hypothetical protein